jgi:WhiB family redox-sensing transcriptional regulator
MTGARASWHEDAACRSADRTAVRGQHPAEPGQGGLHGLPRADQCLAEALDSRVDFGVWGMTERERRALLRRRPDVASWRQVLESARREHEQPRASCLFGPRAAGG